MLVAWILEDRLPVQPQLQPHKIFVINPVSNQKAVIPFRIGFSTVCACRFRGLSLSLFEF